jgi:hypothetical protein
MDEAPPIPKRSRAGRKTVRTAAVRKRFLRAIRDGLSIKHACEVSGVSQPTLYEWRKADPTFHAAIERAIADRCQTLLKIMRTAAKRDWRAAAALLAISTGAAEYASKNRDNPRVSISAEKVIVYLPQKDPAPEELEAPDVKALPD